MFLNWLFLLLCSISLFILSFHQASLICIFCMLSSFASSLFLDSSFLSVFFFNCYVCCPFILFILCLFIYLFPFLLKFFLSWFSHSVFLYFFILPPPPYFFPTGPSVQLLPSRSMTPCLFSIPWRYWNIQTHFTFCHRYSSFLKTLKIYRVEKPKST
jgi:hypothetical protein